MARRPEDRTDVDLVLEEISKRLQRIERTTDKTLSTAARSGKMDTAPVGIRAALKQKMIRGIFGNYIGSAIIRKGEKKRMDRELRVQREEELEHERDLSELRKPTSSSDTISKGMNEKLENLMIASEKMSKSMSDMNENLLKISTIVVAIQKRVSPRDVAVGESKTIRYDPLAPAQFQYSEVSASGKSARIAKKEDARSAAFKVARKMAAEDTSTAQLVPKDEYAEEKKDIKKSEKIDFQAEDVNAKRYEKIQETLDEINKKLDKGGFFGDLMKAIVGVGSTIALTLKAAIGKVMTTILGFAGSLGGKLAEMMVRFGPILARFAGPAAAIAGAGLAGWKAGEWLNENTNIQENIASGVDTVKGFFGASDEDKMKQADTESAQKSYDKRVASGEKMNQSLANYYESNGVAVDKSLIVDDKTWASMNQAPKKGGDLKLMRPEDLRGADIDRESREMLDGREDKKTNEIKTIVLPQQAPPKKSSGAVSEMPVTIKVRNTDPTLSTYRASIFDHPVTHPGNFMM
jgi:hypothetical protein